jgi:phospholipase/lecithinase/hemolysin
MVAPVASTSLFVVWGGPDDLLAPNPADSGNPVAIANTAEANIINIVKGIQALGGTRILVPGVTDLALVPAYSTQTAAATLFATTFNADLVRDLPAGATYVDTFNLLNNIVANPSQYGFTNVTSPCLVNSTPCANPDQYLFWDGQHPTAAGHALLAQALEQSLEPVPEPNPAILTFSVLGLLAMARRYVVRVG